MLVESIVEALAVVLGVDDGKGVSFYLDPYIAVADPGLYAESVTRLLGTRNDRLFDMILQNLGRKTGTPITPAHSFGEAVADAKLRFVERGRPSPT